MAFSDTWTESSPTGSTYANTLATIITQAVKRAWRERFAVDHYAYADESGHDDVGYHKQMTLPVLAADPTEVASAGIVYTKDVSSKAELHFIDEDGDVIQITSGGGMAVLPSGIITIWHGTIANIPSGWVICDGNNSTPNLLSKMVRGVASAVTDPGTTGGADALVGDTVSHVLTTAEIPAHTHSYNNSIAPAELADGGSSRNVGDQAGTTGSTGDGGGHVHSLVGVACIPAYYAVAFIMKS